MPGIDIGRVLDSTARTQVVQEARVQRDQDPEHQKLRKATQEMEAFFVGVLLKKMHASETKNALFGQSSESATWREMFDDAVATQVSKRGAFGLANMLYSKMADNLGTKES